MGAATMAPVGGVGERLEDQGAAQHLLPVRPLVGAAGRPVPPEADGALDPGRDLLAAQAVELDLVGELVGEGQERLVAATHRGRALAAADVGLGQRDPGLQHQGVGAA